MASKDHSGRVAIFALVLVIIAIIVIIAIFSTYLPKIGKNNTAINSNASAISSNTKSIAAIQSFLTTPNTILPVSLGSVLMDTVNYISSSNALSILGTYTFTQVGYWNVSLPVLYTTVSETSPSSTASPMPVLTGSTSSSYYFVADPVSVVQLQFGLYSSKTTATQVTTTGADSIFLYQNNLTMNGYNIYEINMTVQITSPNTTYYACSYIGYGGSNTALLVASLNGGNATLTTM